MSSEFNPIKELGDYLGAINYRPMGKVTLMDGYWEKDGAYYMATVIRSGVTAGDSKVLGSLSIDMDTFHEVHSAEVDFKALHEDIRCTRGCNVIN